MSYFTKLLSKTHEKQKFSCGNDQLDNYFRHQASQDIKGKMAACFVLSENNKRIQGYYTLSNGGIPRSVLPENFSKKLPKYKDLPITILGRLAIDKDFQQQGLGSLLLIDALKRCHETAVNSIASMAVVIDPIDQNAIAFYTHFGFIFLPGSKRMFLPMHTIKQLLR